MPKPYAQDTKDYSQELNNNHYYFRNCMLDLFNFDKFLVLGAKGTGKSYIYKSLANEDVVANLKTLAHKEDCNYQFVQVITSDSLFNTVKLPCVPDFDTDLFYERFWSVYIWDVVMQHEPFGYKTKLPTFKINNDTETSEIFKTRILDTEMICSIERDLESLDKYLQNNGQRNYVIVVFDELDSIIRPKLWSERISPLVNLCKSMKYSRISPKVFLRSDIFEKLANLNNKTDLHNKSINIEWSREELFAFFFKIVLAHSKESFLELQRIYDYYPNEELEKVEIKLQENNFQPPLDDNLLACLAATFFGKYASEDGSAAYGLSYDWFFNNLKNANETLNIRPFIDLLTEAIGQALKSNKKQLKPVLSSLYYSNRYARTQAVKRHIDDLSSEDGNRDLPVVFDYIRLNAPAKYKKDILRIEDFNNLLDLVIADGHLIENTEKEGLVNMLLLNGVIRQKNFKYAAGQGYNGYQFALLYKYYLGLRTKKRKQY